MNLTQEPWYDWVCQQTQATACVDAHPVQSLWSGYGQILRLTSLDGTPQSTILKRIAPPKTQDHPRGWATDRSHQRKLRSYEVESHWYTSWSTLVPKEALIPQCLGTRTLNNEHWMLLEDLDAAGYPARAESLPEAGIAACLRWLAFFHGRFLHSKPDGLWTVGSYWHLDTRPDELAAMNEEALRSAAPIIDHRLSNARFKTLVHGDAKVANFCFSEDLSHAAAVDFQYVGGGCGMKDVAYFLGSCLDENACEQGETHYLKLYFSYLKEAVEQHHPDIDFQALETEWRELFPVAWTDFHRFLLGWMPGHWKVNTYSRRLAAEVLASLGT